MRLVLVAVGRLKAGPERDLVARYIERASAMARAQGFTEIALRELEESRARRPEDRKAEEAKAIAALCPPGGRLWLLDERGKTPTSEALAEALAQDRDAGVPATLLVIGGPDGLDPALRARADRVIAFGALTWPHQLARIMAAEQIYRALTILAGHPYHRV